MNSTTTSAPLIDYGIPAPDRRPITITTRRSMFLPGEDGQLRHTPSGSTVTVEMHTLGMLAPDDYEIISTVSPVIADHRE